MKCTFLILNCFSNQVGVCGGGGLFLTPLAMGLHNINPSLGERRVKLHIKQVKHTHDF